jgi:hypothetical protein
MTMPHSKRPRRARVAKKRARLGLPPLGEPEQIVPSVEPVGGVTSLMIPLATQTRILLAKVRRESQLRDPATVASDQLFASAVLTVALIQIHDSMWPPASPLIVPPTQANTEQAHKVGKVLGRTFVG